MKDRDREDPNPGQGQGPPDGKGRPVEHGRLITPHRSSAKISESRMRTSCRKFSLHTLGLSSGASPKEFGC